MTDYTFKQYQAEASTTAIYPRDAAVLYPVLGFLGESGEMAEKLLKAMFPAGAPEGWDDRGMWMRNLFRAINDLVTAAKSCEVLKKLIRDKTAELPSGVMDEIKARVLVMTDVEREGFLKEVGDAACWYAQAICGDMGVQLAQVAQQNRDKLFARKEKGTLQGSGDAR